MAKKLLSLILAFTFITQSAIPAGYAQSLPVSILPVLANLPVLKYLSLNPANPNNYFNFLLDTDGDARFLSPGGRGQGEGEVKKLINYFFLGLTLPLDAFWVNLQPNQEDKLTSSELAKTDLGRVLLEQDLKLKKDMANYLSPRNPVGKEYWEKLYSRGSRHGGQAGLEARDSGLGTRGSAIPEFRTSNPEPRIPSIQTNNRVWIIPEKSVVVETEDGALITEAKLKVMLEAEYFEHLRGGGDSSEVDKVKEDQVQRISEQLMKEIVIPAITKDVNESPGYAPLRQIYHSLILAQYYKRKVSQLAGEPVSRLTNEPANRQTSSPVDTYLNSGKTQGFESQVPWSKDAIYQDYLKSYTQGEYKFIDKTIFNLKRMYFSGGIILGSSPLTVISAKAGGAYPYELKFNGGNSASPVLFRNQRDKDIAVGNPVIISTREADRKREAESRALKLFSHLLLLFALYFNSVPGSYASEKQVENQEFSFEVTQDQDGAKAGVKFNNLKGKNFGIDMGIIQGGGGLISESPYFGLTLGKIKNSENNKGGFKAGWYFSDLKMIEDQQQPLNIISMDARKIRRFPLSRKIDFSAGVDLFGSINGNFYDQSIGGFWQSGAGGQFSYSFSPTVRGILGASQAFEPNFVNIQNTSLAGLKLYSSERNYWLESAKYFSWGKARAGIDFREKLLEKEKAVFLILHSLRAGNLEMRAGQTSSRNLDLIPNKKFIAIENSWRYLPFNSALKFVASQEKVKYRGSIEFNIDKVGVELSVPLGVMPLKSKIDLVPMAGLGDKKTYKEEEWGVGSRNGRIKFVYDKKDIGNLKYWDFFLWGDTPSPNNPMKGYGPNNKGIFLEDALQVIASKPSYSEFLANIRNEIKSLDELVIFVSVLGRKLGYYSYGGLVGNYFTGEQANFISNEEIYASLRNSILTDAPIPATVCRGISRFVAEVANSAGLQKEIRAYTAVVQPQGNTHVVVLLVTSQRTYVLDYGKITLVKTLDPFEALLVYQKKQGRIATNHYIYDSDGKYIGSIQTPYTKLINKGLTVNKGKTSLEVLRDDFEDVEPSAEEIKKQNDSGSSPLIRSTGGIDLNNIELTLKDEKFISNLNPADFKILLAAKALKEGANLLSLLRLHEAMGLLKDDIVKSIRNKGLLIQLLTQLQTRNSLDPQGMQFLYFIQKRSALNSVSPTDKF